MAMEMIAAEMCEVLNPMLALNKLTVFSNAKKSGSCHAVTDNVIAADTTKYRNPLDKVLPEQDKLQSREMVSCSEGEERSTAQENGPEVMKSPYGQKADQPSNYVNADLHSESNRPSNPKPPSTVEGVDPGLVAKSMCESQSTNRPKSQRAIASRDTIALADNEQCVTVEGAIDSVQSSAKEAATQQDFVTGPTIQSAEIAVQETVAKVTSRYSRSPRPTHATASPLRSRARPKSVALVKQNSSFGGALCCSMKTKTFQVTRHMSPMTPENERQARLTNRRKQTSRNPNAFRQQQQQQQQNDFNLHIDLPEITTDPTSSVSHMTSVSEANASSVVLLPLFPPMLRKNPTDKPSAARPIRDISPSYSPTQVIENTARSVASYFSSASTSPASLDDTSRRRTKSPSTRIQHSSSKSQSPSLSMFSHDDTNFVHEPRSRGKSASSSQNFRRVNSTVVPTGTGNSPGLTKKIYQSGGKRCLSPNKSPQEPRKILAPSSPLNPMPPSTRRQLSADVSQTIDRVQISRKSAISQKNPILSPSVK